MFKALFAVFSCVLALSMQVAVAHAVSKQEQLFLQAMVPLPEPTSEQMGQRMIEPGAVIRAYIKSGHIRKKPDYAADYVDYRKFKKPATLFGHKLLVIEEEYLEKYLGCCVNPGIGAVIEVNGSMSELETYLTANKCRIDFPSGPEGILVDLKIKPKPGKTYHHIRCRANDIFATE